MPIGVVAMFKSEKGYGFIRPADGGPDLFVHQSSIVGDGFRHLLVGEPVEYEVGYNEAKQNDQAVQVRMPEGRRSGIVLSFDHAKGYGFIACEDHPDLFFHYKNILKAGSEKATAEEGEEVQFDIEERSDDGRVHAVRVKRSDSRPPLLRFADMGDENYWLDKLASVAEPEPWQHVVNPNPHTSWPILKSYVTHTFARLQAEDQENVGSKIAMGRDGNKPVACFNTGLVKENQEEVFALFSAKPPSADGRNWRLSGFHAASDAQMFNKFDKFPELAYYFDDPSILLYDRRIPLYLDIDHIIKDNIDRFPVELRSNPYLARQSLEAAREQTRQRVYRNYKTAIPQFHRGSVQLLLPLCLLAPGKADLALVVGRKGEQYRGETVLTLDMAYNNARLLCRPDSDWLTP